ncbi:MAG: hypothetical protein HOP16_17580 [Acidobacteria bacterium]|nr:hypothetical protein [Acidobacteriota bacterium]
MNRRLLLLPVVCAATLMLVAGPHVAVPQAQARATGTISGHVRLTGPAPANSAIRMGADPLCSRANAGKRPAQEVVLRSADGGLANAFVDLQGTFPQTPVPTSQVTIDQHGCMFVPRVIGIRAGQTLKITNSDPTAHNLHSVSAKGNEFNVSQPKTGMTSTFTVKSAELLRIKCDMHSWMVSYVGVSPHPYFAVSGSDGTFQIANVPPGHHTIQVWHERYGRLTAAVDVKAGATATADFSYTGKEQPSTAGIRDLQVPGEGWAVTLLAKR